MHPGGRDTDAAYGADAQFKVQCPFPCLPRQRTRGITGAAGKTVAVRVAPCRGEPGTGWIYTTKRVPLRPGVCAVSGPCGAHDAGKGHGHRSRPVAAPGLHNSGKGRGAPRQTGCGTWAHNTGKGRGGTAADRWRHLGSQLRQRPWGTAPDRWRHPSSQHRQRPLGTAVDRWRHLGSQHRHRPWAPQQIEGGTRELATLAKAMGTRAHNTGKGLGHRNRPVAVT